MPGIHPRFPPNPKIRFTIDCEDLDYAVDGFIEKQGYRLFSVFPADDPASAIVEKNGTFVKLKKNAREERDPESAELTGRPAVVSPGGTAWNIGRAGMQYRDLVPGRLGGKLIASHIRIPDGGPVPDYVHFHRIDFQVIYCLSGWCRLVYEAQGEPFLFEEGDCVLQPPGIRHRVLECSDGFEVVEISSPAEHTTYAEHSFGLPTAEKDEDLDFEGQRFHRFIAGPDGKGQTDLGLEKPSEGKIEGTIILGAKGEQIGSDDVRDSFLYVLAGEGIYFDADGKGPELKGNSSCILPAGSSAGIEIKRSSTKVLRFRLAL